MDENQEEKQRRMAFYLRVSTDDQAERYGLDAQRSAVEAIFKVRGNLKDGRPTMVFAGERYVYIDSGISGTIELDERPAFAQLKEDYLNALPGQKPFDTVAVFKIDRFARKLRILMDVLKFFEKNNIEFISATESIDTSTPFGRAMLGIMGVIAELERETIFQRTQSGREQAVHKGVLMGANAPFGYQKNNDGQIVPLDKEADVVKKIFQLFTVNKFNTLNIADTLRKQEILSPDASAIHYHKRRGEVRKLNSLHHWRMESVRSILSDEVYTGIRYYNKSKKGRLLPKNEWKLSSFKHEPIIPKPTFEFAQRLLSDMSARRTLTKKKEEGHIYLLSGLLKCDYCRTTRSSKDADMSWTGDQKLIEKNPKRYSFYYKCNHKNRKKYTTICPVIPIPAGPLEEYVVNFIKELLDNPDATYEYQKGLDSTGLNIKRLENERKTYLGLLNALPQRKVHILEQHEAGAFDGMELRKKLNELKTKEEDFTKKLDEIGYKLSKETMSDGYKISLTEYQERYRKALEKDMQDRKELYDIVHGLVDQIIVHARPKTEKDTIAGRKRGEQFIPDRVDIYLKLPQYLLQQLVAQKFGVRSDNL